MIQQDTVDKAPLQTSYPDIRIGEILKFSTLDYPGKLSAVVFCQGCLNRCVYCHNPDFLNINKNGKIKFRYLIEFLKNRIGLLDAVVFSGGEPTIQEALPEAIEIIKELGFMVGIHTSGILPEKLDKLLKLVDWVGFDIKTTFKNYEKITKFPGSGEFAKKSFDKLVNSDRSFEIRTTVDSRYISSDDLCEIAKFLQANKVKKWILQECVLRNFRNEIKIPLPEQQTIDELSRYVKVELRK
ncbi:MAG: anaerobic ribonucleoside-triphosphate reductase activating protein [Holosporales bacterium]|jgi:pyruvate formate lyase activating enzyme|nr:anaerobic ribonucleoside-triphosphate reductase activating protein [Holosporales bacterium]